MELGVTSRGVYGWDVCPATYPSTEGDSEIRLTEAARLRLNRQNANA
jgi:hypothetical protein